MSHWAALIDPQAVIPRGGSGTVYTPLGADDAPPPKVKAPPRPKKPAKERRTRAEWLAGRWLVSYKRQLLMQLQDGPMSEREFRALARKLYAGDAHENTVPGAIQRLLAEGLIRCEVSLTPEGLRKLGLKGPQ